MSALPEANRPCSRNFLILLKKIKDLGYLVKLDTNGSHPEVLKSLCHSNLIDYVAMDIKHAPSRYQEICNAPSFSMEKIAESAAFLLEGTVPYEFRTTIVRELHTLKDFEEIGAWIAGADSYFLQSYQESEQVIHPVFSSYTKKKNWRISSPFCRNIFPHVEIRGVDA